MNKDLDPFAHLVLFQIVLIMSIIQLRQYSLILLCTFHVRKCGTQKLIEVVTTHDDHVAMNTTLGDIMYGSCLNPDPHTPTSDWLERDTRTKF